MTVLTKVKLFLLTNTLFSLAVNLAGKTKMKKQNQIKKINDEITKKPSWESCRDFIRLVPSRYLCVLGVREDWELV